MDKTFSHTTLYAFMKVYKTNINTYTFQKQIRRHAVRYCVIEGTMEQYKKRAGTYGKHAGTDGRSARTMLHQGCERGEKSCVSMFLNRKIDKIAFLSKSDMKFEISVKCKAVYLDF